MCAIPVILKCQTFKFPNIASRSVLYSWIAGALDPCRILALWFKFQFPQTFHAVREAIVHINSHGPSVSIHYIHSL